MRIAAIFLFTLTAVGCAGPRTQLVRTTSTGTFSPPERRAVWGRAVVAFNRDGFLIASASADSGVLRTEVQPGWTSCTNTNPNQWVEDKNLIICPETRFSQFTMGDQGTAFLRVHRTVHGISSENTFLTNGELAAMQREADELLRFILGESQTEAAARASADAQAAREQPAPKQTAPAQLAAPVEPKPENDLPIELKNSPFN